MKIFYQLISIILILFIGFIIFLFLNTKEVCKQYNLNILGNQIHFPIGLKQGMIKYNLIYNNYKANSNLSKDTIMIIVSDPKNGLNNELNNKNLNNYKVHAYLFYIKNPSKLYFVNLKIHLEKQFGKNFEKRKFKHVDYFPGYYYILNVNNCIQITLKEHDHILNYKYNIQNKNEESCVLGIYFNVHEDDVENGTGNSGELMDIQGLRF